MNKRFMRDGFEYYLEIEGQGGEEYEYQMLIVNRMESILPVNVTMAEGKRQLIYQASGYKTLDSCLEKMIITGEQILRVLESVLNGIDDTKRFLLSQDNLVLSPEYLFVESDYSKVGLIYVPGYGRDIILQLRDLMERLMERIDESDMASVMLAWKMRTLMKDEHISLREIRKLMAGYQKKEPGQPIPTEEKETEAEFHDVHTVFGIKDKVRKRSEKGKLAPAVILGLVTVLILLAADLGVVFLIYRDGIEFWKRNLLLLLTVLLCVSIGATVVLWKKEKTMGILRHLQSKVKDYFPYS